MSKITSLKPKKEKELLKAAQPVVKIFSAIDSLQKKISEKEKQKKLKNKQIVPEEIEKLKARLEEKMKELKKMGKAKVAEGIKAIRLLVYYHRYLVRYITRGAPSFGGKIDHEDLIAEGMIALLKAIEKFDLNRGFRLSSYGGYWIKQRQKSFININQLINQGPLVKEKKNVVYYDNNYQNDDKESKSYSLIETLDDSENATLTTNNIRQKDAAIQVNSLINSLESCEAILLVRLVNKIMPSNLLDIYCMATDEEKKKLRENFKLSESADLSTFQQYSLQEKKISKLAVVKNYLAMMSRTYKSSELAKLLNKSENAVRKLKQDSLEKLKKMAEERKLRFLIT